VTSAGLINDSSPHLYMTHHETDTQRDSASGVAYTSAWPIRRGLCLWRGLYSLCTHTFLGDEEPARWHCYCTFSRLHFLRLLYKAHEKDHPPWPRLRRRSSVGETHRSGGEIRRSSGGRKHAAEAWVKHAAAAGEKYAAAGEKQAAAAGEKHAGRHSTPRRGCRRASHSSPLPRSDTFSRLLSDLSLPLLHLASATHVRLLESPIPSRPRRLHQLPVRPCPRGVKYTRRQRACAPCPPVLRTRLHCTRCAPQSGYSATRHGPAWWWRFCQFSRHISIRKRLTCDERVTE
jgi:hypothetical protein